MSRSVIIFCCCFGWWSCGSSSGRAEDFTPLFDGKTLQGWKRVQEWGKVWVENGEIHLQGDRKFFLVTEKTYGDFILEGEVLVPIGGNSGFQVRSHFQGNKLWGYQAEVDTSARRWAGGIYDEGRRAWLATLVNKPQAQAAFKNGEWNHYRVECLGDRLRVFVNGVQTADWVDSMDIDGHIALQHHGEKGKLYKFRNVRIRDLGRRQWTPLFDGKTLTGWRVLPGGKWEIKDGVIFGTSPQSEARHGMLLSEKSYRDFTVRLKYRAHQGNSGLYFRAEPVPGELSVHGLQAEIDPEKDAGGLYETGGRGWVVKPEPAQVKKWYKPNQWNQMTVSAQGGRVVVHVNGFKTADLANDSGRAEGHFGLQLHGGMEMHVEFKDIELLGAPAPLPFTAAAR